MKFTSEIINTANSIYNKFKMNGQVNTSNWKLMKSESYKQCFRYFKAIVKKAINFIKLSGEVVCRKIDYVSVFTDYPNFDKDRFFAWDLEASKVISFYPYQIIN
jgi:hypothetical protein